MKNLKTFLVGMFTMAIVGSFGVTALANTGVLTLQVTPVKVMVNNQEFKPKDARGNEVIVFNYNGTLYAPLRSLAETYGLQVGWDQQKQMATVEKRGLTPTIPVAPITPTDPKTVSITLEEMKKMFKFNCIGEIGDRKNYAYQYCGDKPFEEFKSYWTSINEKDIDSALQQWVLEISKQDGQTKDKDIQVSIEFNVTFSCGYMCYGIEKGFYKI